MLFAFLTGIIVSPVAQPWASDGTQDAALRAVMHVGAYDRIIAALR